MLFVYYFLDAQARLPGLAARSPKTATLVKRALCSPQSIPLPTGVAKMSNQVYLGDGAYARFDGYQLELYTSNGIEETNNIYLDAHKLENLFIFLKHIGIKVGENE